MTSKKLRTINAYPQLKTADGINEVLRYVITKNIPNPQIPRDLNTRQIRTFINRFSTDFIVDDNKLYYAPLTPDVEHRIRLQVVPPEDKARLLNELYNDDITGLKGITLFYKMVSSKYIPFTREETTDFLKSKSNYQIAVNKPSKAVNQPILAKTPNERWICDTFELRQYTRQNQGYLHILVVVDCFSRKVWARPLKLITAEDTLTAFREILDDTRTHPRILQCDNGNSFKGVFEEYVTEYNQGRPNDSKMKVINSVPYQPRTNGLVERMNRRIREVIKQGFTQHNNLQWVRYLPDYVQNINSSYNATIKMTPNELWAEGYSKPVIRDISFQPVTDSSSKHDIAKHAQANTVTRALKLIEKNKEPDLSVGDTVRIRMSKVSQEMRKRNKGLIGKKHTAITFTIDTYRISRIVAKPDYRDEDGELLQRNNSRYWSLGKPRYELLAKNDVGQYTLPVGNNETHEPYFFYAQDLQKVVANSAVPTVGTHQRSRYINRFTNERPVRQVARPVPVMDAINAVPAVRPRRRRVPDPDILPVVRPQRARVMTERGRAYQEQNAR